MIVWRIIIVLVLAPVHLVTADFGREAKPPAKPDFTYISPNFSVRQQGSCLHGTRVWIYSPQIPKSDPTDAIVYLHGFGITSPDFYEGHIEHLVKQGNYVIYPQMQEGSCEIFRGKLLGWAVQLSQRSSPARWVKRAGEVVTEALDSLPSVGKVFLYGHSMGGAFAMMWGSLNTVDPIEAAVVASPQPAGFSAIPGIITTLFFFRFGEDIDVPEAAPSTTFPIAVIHGNDDTIASEQDILPSYEALGSTSKAWYQAQSDKHGHPSLSADHIQPLAKRREARQDSFDWRFTWSALDQVIGGTAVTDLGFDMGQWSDGVPVKSAVKLY
jgi:pimeloyl-ACP methyl ester carboxylesterase